MPTPSKELTALMNDNGYVNLTAYRTATKRELRLSKRQRKLIRHIKSGMFLFIYADDADKYFKDNEEKNRKIAAPLVKARASKHVIAERTFSLQVEFDKLLDIIENMNKKLDVLKKTQDALANEFGL